MKKPFGAAALLLTTALVAPAYAQTAGTGGASSTTGSPARGTTPTAAQPAAEAPVEVSTPGADQLEIVVTGRNTPNIVRATPQVVSVLSAADIARTGEGDIAGALSRVTGLSVVGNGFVYVRGLGDRYSLALLNGSPLPSPEPLRRTIPLDIFPTSVLASTLVQKSYSVNYPAEFGGGVINLTTAALPKESFLSFGSSISGDSITTAKLGYTYYGSRTDWTGFDNGTRDLPAPLRNAFATGKAIIVGQDFTQRQVQDITASLVNARTSLLQRNTDIPANFAADLSAGTRFSAGDVDLGIIAAAGFSNSWKTRDAIQQLSGGLTGGQINPDVNFRTVLTDNRIVVNGLLGLGAEFGANKIRWTNLYIRDTLKQGRLARGVDGLGGDGVTPIIDQATRWYERQLIDSQAVAEFRFGKLGLDLRGGYANSQREAPYERSFRYLYSATARDFVNNLGQAGTARIAFSDLNEDLWSGGADVSLKLPTVMPISLSAGYAYGDTKRNSVRREFRFLATGGALPALVAQERPDYLLSDYNVYTYGIILTETSAQSGAAAYDAGLRTHAGYGQVTIEPFSGFTINGGVRYEKARQFVTPLELSGAPSGTIRATRLNNDYWLPAATITWNFMPDVQLRLNASKTIARPQFRELAFQVYQDTDSDRQFFGNPFLTDSRLTNGEGRLEWYFARDQRISAAGFYKKIKNPIETFAFRSSSLLQTSFANAPSAELYGGEVEVQKYFPFRGEGFFASRRGVVIANYTYTKSKLQVGAGDLITFADGSRQAASDYFRNGGPLTGQSDHLVNLQLGLEDTDNLSQQTVLLTYASERVTNRGPSGTPQQPDIIEKPGLRIDFVARQGVTVAGAEFELKFEARNLTGTRSQEFQTVNGSRIDINTFDVGRSLSLGFAVKL